MVEEMVENEVNFLNNLMIPMLIGYCSIPCWGISTQNTVFYAPKWSKRLDLCGVTTAVK